MHRGHGGGLLVSALAFHSNDLSLNPVGSVNFQREKTAINKERLGMAHLKNLLRG